MSQDSVMIVVESFEKYAQGNHYISVCYNWTRRAVLADTPFKLQSTL